jgi:hypothetical protein
MIDALFTVAVFGTLGLALSGSVGGRESESGDIPKKKLAGKFHCPGENECFESEA